MSMNLKQIREAIKKGIPVYWLTSTVFEVFKEGNTLYMSNNSGDSIAIAQDGDSDFINGEPHEFTTVQPLSGKIVNDSTEYLLLKITGGGSRAEIANALSLLTALLKADNPITDVAGCYNNQIINVEFS